LPFAAPDLRVKPHPPESVTNPREFLERSDFTTPHLFWKTKKREQRPRSLSRKWLG
jgi:hypothetical protein